MSLAGIIENWFVAQVVLPFLLTFVLVFAILRKTKLLGDNPKVDSMVGLLMGLLFVSVPTTREFVAAFVPWMATALAVLLVFFILYGFVGGEFKDFPKEFKWAVGILSAIFVIVVVFYVTGAGSYFMSIFETEWISYIIILILLVLMIWWVTKSK